MVRNAPRPRLPHGSHIRSLHQRICTPSRPLLLLLHDLSPSPPNAPHLPRPTRRPLYPLPCWPHNESQHPCHQPRIPNRRSAGSDYEGQVPSRATFRPRPGRRGDGGNECGAEYAGGVYAAESRGGCGCGHRRYVWRVCEGRCGQAWLKELLGWCRES